MLRIPDAVIGRYEYILKNREVAVDRFSDYRKWLRYFLDFRTKYQLPDSKAEQVRQFNEKLREKKQTEQQRQQAIHAVFLFFEMLRQETQPEEVGDVPARQRCERHYSRKTLRTYANWSRRFQDKDNSRRGFTSIIYFTKFI